MTALPTVDAAVPIVALAIPGAILLLRTLPVLAIAGLTVLAGVHVAVGPPMFPMWFGVLVVLYDAVAAD